MTRKPISNCLNRFEKLEIHYYFIALLRWRLETATMTKIKSRFQRSFRIRRGIYLCYYNQWKVICILYILKYSQPPNKRAPAPSNILLILDFSNLDHLQLVKGKDTELFKSKSVNTHIMWYQLLMHKSLTWIIFLFICIYRLFMYIYRYLYLWFYNCPIKFRWVGILFW